MDIDDAIEEVLMLYEIGIKLLEALEIVKEKINLEVQNGFC